MNNYLMLMARIMQEGADKPDRTGTGTFSLFGEQLRFNLQKGFPLLTTKKLHFKSIVTELLWFLQGRNDVRWLQERGCTIWDEWVKTDGTLGPVYGCQWRNFGEATMLDQGNADDHGVDQLKQLVDGLRSDPHGRRHIVSAWNPLELGEMALPPCHILAQFYVAAGASMSEPIRLSCHMYQRSADIFLGVPYNIASYALLTSLLALELQMEPDKLIISFGDVHLYKNHIEQARLQLSRETKELPTLGLHFKQGALTYRKDEPLSKPNYEPEDIFLVGYNAHPSIKAPVAV